MSNCTHHWKQEKTTHEVEAGKGLSTVGMTAGICLKCGATKDWQSVTPDGVHGMDSHILSDMGGKGRWRRKQVERDGSPK